MTVSPSSDPASSSEPQTAGRYVVCAALGEGPTGSVYRAVDSLTGSPVALKLFAPLAPAPAPDEFRQRVLRAADAARTLSHPNIVAIHDFGQCADGTPYVVMESLGGLTLRDGIDSGIVLPPHKIIDLAMLVLDGLDHAHQRGVTHGDLKPANVMLAHYGSVKILDFGIALDAREMLAAPPAPPIYLAPEQLPPGAADARSDLFALGVILYELLTGTHPFAGDSPGAVLHNIMHLDPRPPGELNAEVPPGLDQVVMRALAKDPVARFANAREMRDALGAVCAALRDTASSAGTAAAGPSMFAPEPLPIAAAARRSWRREAAFAGAVLVVIGALVAFTHREPVPLARSIKPAAPAPAPAAATTAAPAGEPVTQPLPADSAPAAAPPIRSAPAMPTQPPPAREPARAKVRAQEDVPEGRLQLAVLPWGEVHVNGRRLAVTPPQRVLELPAGVYRVEIRNGPFPPRVQKVRIEPGKSVSIRHRFQ